MTRTAFIRTNQFGNPEGVPSPYVMHRHPYPTRFHGGRWERPVFTFPQIQKTQSVFTPGYDITNGANGLGCAGQRCVSVRGLGGWNVGNGVFKPGGYGGGIFDGNLSGLGGLGNDTVDYPWKSYSQKTLELQQFTNQALKQAGYCPISEDGKLGPATCGARAQLTIDYAGRTLFNLPSTCPSPSVTPYTMPKKSTGGCTSSAPITTMPTTTTTTLQPVESSMMSSSTKKALAFMIGGVAAAALVVFLKKKSASSPAT